MKFGVYIGTQSDPVGNVLPVLKSWNTFLTTSDIRMELFGSASLSPSAMNSFDHVKQEDRPDKLPHKIIRGYQYTRDYIREHNPDVVMQVWKYATHAPGVALAGHRYGVPTIGRFTGDTFNEYRGFSFPKRLGIYGLNNLNGRVPLYFFDQMIALGPYGKSELVDHGVAEEDVEIIPPPTPAGDQFSSPESVSQYRSELGISQDKTVFLYVGRLTSQKGMEFLRETISALPSLEEYLFLLIGSGRYRSVFAQEFDDNAVRAIGRVEHKEIHKYYKSVDCYLHPSPYEGLPLVVLEALSCGVPVLARPAGDIGFVSGNLAKTPDQMATAILEEAYTHEWKNRELFELTEQRNRIENIVTNSRFR